MEDKKTDIVPIDKNDPATVEKLVKELNLEKPVNVEYNEILPKWFMKVDQMNYGKNGAVINYEMHNEIDNPNSLILNKVAGCVDGYEKVDPFIPIQDNMLAVTKLNDDLIKRCVDVVMNITKEELLQSIYIYCKNVSYNVDEYAKDIFGTSGEFNPYPNLISDDVFVSIGNDVEEYIRRGYVYGLVEQCAMEILYVRFTGYVYNAIVKAFYDHAYHMPDPQGKLMFQFLNTGNYVIQDFFPGFADMSLPTFAALPYRIFQTAYTANAEYFSKPKSLAEKISTVIGK